MEKITYPAAEFNPRDVLECGQIFRYKKFEKGYLVVSKDKACYLYSDEKSTYIECDDGDYFYNFFDLGRDYAAIIEKLKSFNSPVLSTACDKCRGLRLLNQNPQEMIFSFIVSQNNNIPRIQKSLEAICKNLGEEKNFAGERYFSFPSVSALAEKSASFYKELGLGYRDEYIQKTAERLKESGVDYLKDLDDAALKKELLSFRGIGGKVADCIALFAFKRTSSFPVDTWIEKLYLEDFKGKPAGREAISKYFCNIFGEYSGYAQQYLFYAKRASL